MSRDIVISVAPLDREARRQLEGQRKREREEREGHIVRVPRGRMGVRGLARRERSSHVVRVPGSRLRVVADTLILMKGPGQGNRPLPTGVAEADWAARIAQPGVVWYHNFASSDEVDAFRWTGGIGNDPNDASAQSNWCRYSTADSVTGGGCLELFRPAGTTEGPAWWRPFSPLDTGSGKSVSDPAADGTITVETWLPTQGGSQTADWGSKGYYGHPDYHSGSIFNGKDYFLQVRVKMDANRSGATQPSGGKLFYFTITDFSLSSQELNTISATYVAPNPPYNNYIWLYRSGSPPISDDDPSGNFQIGSDLGGTDADDSWYWSNGWDTLLYHVVPGTNGGNDTVLQIWACKDGEDRYTRIWDQNTIDLPFEVGYPYGHNALIATNYINGLNLAEDFYHRYDEIIFSKEFIQCPGSEPSWFSALSNKEWATPVTNWLGASGVIDPLAWTTNGTHSGIINEWTGMGADQERKTIFMLHNGGHNSYFGNEVYSCDLHDESPAWIRRRDATAQEGGGNLTKWSDGRPVSDHTTNLHVAAEGRWFTPGMASTNYLGFANYQQWWEYDVRTEDYIDLGSTHPSPAGALSVNGLAVYDPVDRQVIVVHTNNSSPSAVFQDIDNMSGAAALTNTNVINSAQGSCGAVDTTNHVLLLRDGTNYFYLKLDSDANKQAAWQSVSVSGTAAPNLNQIYWHKPSQAFITWDGSTGIRKLTPTVSGGGYSSMAWSSVSGNGGDAPTTSGPATGMYGKVNYIEHMGVGASALVVVPRYADPDVYVMRIEGAI